MADEKIINRSLVYICDNQFDCEIKKYFTDNKNVEKKENKIINKLKLAGILASHIVPFVTDSPIVWALSGIGYAMSPSSDSSSFENIFSIFKTNDTSDDAIQVIPIDYVEKCFKHDEIEQKVFQIFQLV